MPGASRLDCRNQRHPAFFMSVWADPECGARDDTNACDGGYARCSNPGVQAGAVLLGRIKISGFSSGR